MPVNIVKKTANGTVSVEKKVGNEDYALVSSASEPVKETVESDQQANVGVQLAFTKNLGNYESIKMSVSLYLPTPPDPEAIDATFRESYEWVNKKLEFILSDVESDLG